MFLPAIKTIGILGAGAFGTSLSISYSGFFKVFLYSADQAQVENMKKTRESEFLKGFRIPDSVSIDNLQNIDPEEVDVAFWCFPANPSVELMTEMAKSRPLPCPIVICSKGLSPASSFLTDEFKRITGHDEIGCLSGPNFASEIASLKVAASNLGFEDLAMATSYSRALSHRFLKLFPTSDIKAMQISGTVKNVIAIAAGIARGLCLGQNAHALILTFGLKEMRKLGEATGADPASFQDLLGLGDLILTASSETSRNTSFGVTVSKGATLAALEGKDAPACEGVFAAQRIFELATKLSLRLPICEAVYRILYESAEPGILLDTIDNSL
jgi:glycerol-3-phosphate dehydrogenase (NAD(P)+)